MRRWVVNLLCAITILLLLVGIGYGLVWLSSFPNPLQLLLPSLGLSSLGFGGGDGGAGAPAGGSGGAGAPPPPAARGSGASTPTGSGPYNAPPPPARRRSAPPPPAHRSALPPPAPRRIAPPPPRARRPPPAPRRNAPPPPQARPSPPAVCPPPPPRARAPPRGNGPATHTTPPPPEQKSVPEGGNADTGDAAAPPPCSPCVSVEEKLARKVMLVLGCVISILSFSNPVIIHWSLDGSLPQTINFHSLWDLIATTASCLAWLLFGITQLLIEGNKVLGVEAIVVNLMGVVVYTLYSVIKMASAANLHSKGCIGAVVALCGPIIIVICFIGFGSMKRDSLVSTWISFGAALVQLFSQFLPFRSLCLLYYPPVDAPAQHASTKKLIIYSRSCNLIVCLYWAMYCVFTYEHDFFEFANVASAVLAFITFTLHLIYALEPQAAAG